MQILRLYFLLILAVCWSTSNTFSQDQSKRITSIASLFSKTDPRWNADLSVNFGPTSRPSFKLKYYRIYGRGIDILLQENTYFFNSSLGISRKISKNQPFQFQGWHIGLGVDYQYQRGHWQWDQSSNQPTYKIYFFYHLINPHVLLQRTFVVRNTYIKTSAEAGIQLKAKIDFQPSYANNFNLQNKRKNPYVGCALSFMTPNTPILNSIDLGVMRNFILDWPRYFDGAKNIYAYIGTSIDLY